VRASVSGRVSSQSYSRTCWSMVRTTSSTGPVVSSSNVAAFRSRGSTVSTKCSVSATSSGFVPYGLFVRVASRSTQHGGRCTQQHNPVELRIEPHLIAARAADEHDIRVDKGGEDRLNPILAPESFGSRG